MDCKKNICDFSECDLLALSALITKELAATVTDADTFDALGDLFTAVGAGMTLMSNQRIRCATKSQG